RIGFNENPKRYLYSDFVKCTLNNHLAGNRYPIAVPNWDNTPRSQMNGLVYVNATPRLCEQHLKKAVALIEDRPVDQQLIFIKSWNEWAEGNYLEPDRINGYAYLEAVKKVVDGVS